MLKNTGKLAGKTLFITGASRGIGKSIALKAAQDGANIVICAKTAEPHPKLPGTIYTAAKEVEEAGGKALPCTVDVRDEAQVNAAVSEAIKKFGGIDIVVNNASAISLTPTLTTEMKRYDLMNQINARGTFLVSKACLPHLLKSKNPHIINLSPPLNLNPQWFKNHLAYTMAKYGMSFCVLGMSEEFKDDGVAVNALWPRTAIHTAAIEMLSGEESKNYSRKPQIMADAAYAIVTKDSRNFTGKFLIDDEVLKEEGITDFTPYACNPEYKDQLMLDFFLDIEDPQKYIKLQSDEKPSGDRNVEVVFKAIEANISPELVKKVGAIYQFNMTGAQKGTWFLDLKNGNGGFGKGTPISPADATLTMESTNFFDMFTGKLKPATAFLMGKLKIDGNLQTAMKLEKLMISLKAKL
ncbi:hydroxysteroid dehydrogenase-like protein 2 [Diachasma alloeum]|uniref:hydroxysteroid dehydrogenase-like protein 2 n=1 Tax=Diachasma alloeum TaxID=454923 RepID=UPI0007383EE5|nr:hydroxysteroid dehydrogenase-like protein 2 [Diachasma alloeum]